MKSNFLKNTIFISCLLLSLFVYGKSAAAAEGHPAGALLLWEGTVYKVADDGSSLQGFDSEEKFLSHYYDFRNIVPINSADKAKAVAGTVPWGQGRLYNENGTIYQVSNGVKYGFASAEIFLSYGFSFSHAVRGNPNLQSQVIESPSQPHLPGTFVSSNGTVWQVTATGRKGVPSPGVLHSWGRQFSDVVPANAWDLIKPDEGILNIRTGSLMNDNGTVWVIEQASKRSFPAAECFTNFGYNFSMLIQGATQGYVNIGNICGPQPPTSSMRTTVQSSRGSFTADIMTFDLSSGEIKVATDTASDNDCLDNCPVQPLLSYVQQAGGFAGIHGTYFCPPDYADCSGKINTFYWKVYNTGLSKMINANNGIKEDKPFMAFDNFKAYYFPTYGAYVSSGIPIVAGINHEPALVENGNNILNTAELDDGQRNTKSTRGALGLKGQTVYAVIVRSANIPDLAAVMQSLGMDYAINLDGGGSSAMVYDGAYKVGPGRNLPNAIIFVRK